MIARDVQVTRAPRIGFVGAFDGMRGLGVIMVLIGHAVFEYLESWVTIVDTFFVLSGFLIATLLLQEAQSTGAIGIKKFYQRRAMRLLPSVWLFVSVWIVLGAIGELLGVEVIKLSEILKDAAAAVTYTYHVFFPNGLPILHPGQQDNRTMWHLWTLSVEEHFYIIIPALVMLCVRFRRLRLLGAAMVAGFVAIGLARLAGYTGPIVADGTFAGVRLAFLQRPDALMLGIALAVINAQLDAEAIDRWRPWIVRFANLGFVLWLAMLNLSSGLWERFGLPYFEYVPTGPAHAAHSDIVQHWYWFRFGHTLGALGTAAMVLAWVRTPDWWFGRFLANKMFMYFGRLSYTLYVWHGLAYLLVFAVTGGDDVSTAFKFARIPLLVAVALAVSLPVYRYVELPVMGMKLRFASEKETLDLRTGKMVATPGRDEAGTEAGTEAGSGTGEDPGTAADSGSGEGRL